MFKTLKHIIIGKPYNPLDSKTRHKIALSVFIAWIGLGADGLSSACYGPEQAFLSLGTHTSLAFYLAIAIAISVFIISFAYNQVIELFPTGGGGYKAATKLLGTYPGLIAGCALIMDYILTITISIASGVAAAFSLFPYSAHAYKLYVDAILIVILIILNLRGMKESIRWLMPIFLGFVVTHLGLIVYGFIQHDNQVALLHQQAHQEIRSIITNSGFITLIALFTRAYSIGGATYTGLEAVSNNVNKLAEPRVRTGKWTMFYMALSLSITAGGILFLYLLWHVFPVEGMTLNAVVFKSVLGQETQLTETILFITLLLEAGLLFLSANTGFLGGPAVLANMAIDNWVPRRFRNLSSRLVTQNGIILFGLGALVLLLATRGRVAYILVLYSVNVFIAFSVSLIGLCRHWWQQREKSSSWPRLFLAALGAIICVAILIILLIERFYEGGLVALLIISCVVAGCWQIKRYYNSVNKKFKEADKLLVSNVMGQPAEKIPEFDPHGPTAVLFIGKSVGVGMHTLLWINRLFPNYFKNFIFVSVGIIDVQSYGADQYFQTLRSRLKRNLDHFVNFAHTHGNAAYALIDYGTDPVEKLTQISEKLYQENPNCIFFASNLVFPTDNWFIRSLHNETAFAVQRKLHLNGIMMMVLPMNLDAAK